MTKQSDKATAATATAVQVSTSTGFLFQLTFSGLAWPFLRTHLRTSQDIPSHLQVCDPSGTIGNSNKPHVSTTVKRLRSSFEHHMCIGATNAKGTHRGQRASALLCNLCLLMKRSYPTAPLATHT